MTFSINDAERNDTLYLVPLAESVYRLLGGVSWRQVGARLPLTPLR
jgi:hypothetical protein